MTKQEIGSPSSVYKSTLSMTPLMDNIYLLPSSSSTSKLGANPLPSLNAISKSSGLYDPLATLEVKDLTIFLSSSFRFSITNALVGSSLNASILEVPANTLLNASSNSLNIVASSS